MRISDWSSDVCSSDLAAGISPRSVRFGVESYAAYGQANVAATERLTVVLGARSTYEPHDDKTIVPTYVHRQETFSSFIPRVSLQYALTEQLHALAPSSVGEESGFATRARRVRPRGGQTGR